MDTEHDMTMTMTTTTTTFFIDSHGGIWVACGADHVEAVAFEPTGIARPADFGDVGVGGAKSGYEALLAEGRIDHGEEGDFPVVVDYINHLGMTLRDVWAYGVSGPNGSEEYGDRVWCAESILRATNDELLSAAQWCADDARYPTTADNVMWQVARAISAQRRWDRPVTGAMWAASMRLVALCGRRRDPFCVVAWRRGHAIALGHSSIIGGAQ